MTLEIRPRRTACAEETAQVDALVTRAFADGGRVARLVEALRASPDALPGLEFVAVQSRGPGDPPQSREAGETGEAGEAGEVVVGHAMLTRGLLDARRELLDVHVLSPLAVHPRLHRQGIGAALVERAVEASQESGAPAVFLEGDPGYYGRLGFVAGEPLGFRRPSLRIPAPAFQVRTAPRHEEWMTGTLIYSRVFWDHDSVGLRDPDLVEIEAALRG